MGNDLDHADHKMPSAGSTKDLSTGRNLHLQRATSACKMPKPIDGRIDASRQMTGGQ
jgi:hypothetical protein